MTITVLYFASLREALGATETIEAQAEPLRSVAEWRRVLRGRSPAHAEVLAEGRAVRASVNKVMAADSTLVADGAELAFFPPVTGG